MRARASTEARRTNAEGRFYPPPSAQLFFHIKRVAPFAVRWPSQHRHDVARAPTTQAGPMTCPFEGTTAAGLRCRRDSVDFLSCARVS